MRAQLIGLSESEKAKAVRTFDARYGEMERALWCLSKYARAPLLAGQSSPVVEALVWTMKSWWGVQGVRSDTKVLMANALAEVVDWSPDLFAEMSWDDSGAEEYACECVRALVDRSRTMGVPRREFSLASKVLHWLMPWRIPVLDDNVRRILGVPASWDASQAYPQVAYEVFAMARLEPEAPNWMGSLEPRSSLRALDKCLWWLGGGDSGTAAVVKNPWRVVYQLGLEPC